MTGGVVTVDEQQRAELLLKAISAGGDLEETSKLLEWGEFERLVEGIVRQHSYSAVLNFRFKRGRKLWQTDVLASKEPLVLCIDCKHLRSRQAAALRRAVELNARRARDLAEELPRLKRRVATRTWRKAAVIPLIVTLKPAPWRTHEAMPIVAVNQLRDFLDGIPAEASHFIGFNRSLMGTEAPLAEPLSGRETVAPKDHIESRGRLT